ncbi:MAG: PorV/PorQ family protein [Candidatus Cloacimonadota bacterium]|nr:PorV/PorQ family protein [Candidatus Cloacimonadota bacterium]
MKKVTRKTTVLLALLMLGITLSAVSNGAALFTLIEPGSRAGSMGSAFVAQADDGFATWWNPGAMAFNRKSQFALTHSNWMKQAFDDLYYEYLSFNKFVPEIGNLGANVIFMSYGEQDEIDDQGTFQGTFMSYEIALGLNYATQLSSSWGVGTNFKIIYSDLAPAIAWTGTQVEERGLSVSYAFDIAAKKKGLNFLPTKNLLDDIDFGFNLQNVGPNMTYINNDQSDPLSMNLRTGFSYRALYSKYSKLTFNFDANKELENSDFVLLRIFTAMFDDPMQDELESIILNVGGEYEYLSLLALRGGYFYDYAGKVFGPTFGAGFKYDFNDMYKITADIGMTQIGLIQENYNITYSMGFEF